MAQGLKPSKSPTITVKAVRGVVLRLTLPKRGRVMTPNSPTEQGSKVPRSQTEPVAAG